MLINFLLLLSSFTYVIAVFVKNETHHCDFEIGSCYKINKNTTHICYIEKDSCFEIKRNFSINDLRIVSGMFGIN